MINDWIQFCSKTCSYFVLYNSFSLINTDISCMHISCRIYKMVHYCTKVLKILSCGTEYIHRWAHGKCKWIFLEVNLGYHWCAFLISLWIKAKKKIIKNIKKKNTHWKCKPSGSWNGLMGLKYLPTDQYH